MVVPPADLVYQKVGIGYDYDCDGGYLCNRLTQHFVITGPAPWCGCGRVVCPSCGICALRIIFSRILTGIVSGCRQSSTATARARRRPEPAHWRAGAMPVHRNCGTDCVVGISDLAAVLGVYALAV